MAKENKGLPNMIYNPKRHPMAVKQIAYLGLTQEESAPYLGIGLSTFRKWLKEYPEFERAWEEGARFVDAQVANALLKSALGYDYTKRIEKVKDHEFDGGSTEDITEEVHVQGNVQAQMFWLANRQRGKWKMKHSDPEDEANSQGGGPVTINFVRGEPKS